MGYIVKATRAMESSTTAAQGGGPPLDSVAAEETEILLAARAAADRMCASAKDDAVLLARKMAEKIVGHAVDLDPSVMADIAEQAVLASRARAASVVLRVHPDDLSAIEQSRPGWLDREGAPGDVRLVADASVGRYGCVVETAVGRVDARLRTQLDVLERVLGGGNSRA